MDDDAIIAEVRDGGVRSVYQAIVDLRSNCVVGYEALARVPRLPNVDPIALFAAARRTGTLNEVEWRCREAAVRGALDAAMPDGQVLFVNLEPSAMGSRPPPDVEPVISRALTELLVVAELTERDLLARPAVVLAQVAALRRAGAGVALDDVGAHPDSLALLEFVRPDVIKLDLNLIQHVPASERARTLMAVMAHCERTGAYLLAEGIETAAHLEQARAVGATLGQGLIFGHPQPTPVCEDAAPWQARPPAAEMAMTPYSLIVDTELPRVATKELLNALTRDIERQAANSADPPVVLVAFQHAHWLSSGAAERYGEMARRSPLVAVFGEGMPREPTPGVRGVALAPDDPMRAEWVLVVLGAHYSAAMIARERPSTVDEDADPLTADNLRRFDFLLTHDRELVAAAGRSLLSRMTGSHAPPAQA